MWLGFAAPLTDAEAYYFFNILLFFAIQIQKFPASFPLAYHFTTNTNYKVFCVDVDVRNEKKQNVGEYIFEH